MADTPARFGLGRIVATPGAVEAMRRAGQPPAPLLDRHRRGDFGELDPRDVREQTLALQQEHDPDARQRMMSVYRLEDGTTL
jgi:hypothetical protein